MINEVPTPVWMETDWILGQFSEYREKAIANYIDFVREGIGLPSIGTHLKNQIFLGTETFTRKHHEQIKQKGDLKAVPRIQKQELPRPLAYYAQKYSNQKLAILQAYLSGGYTLKEIGCYFGKHYSTISRVIKSFE